MRDTIFISHANPEDNEFALWLSLRLGVEGYRVWCDLTGLLGGEDFWSDIEDIIRNNAAKFLFILSDSSNHKKGVLNELAVAQTVARSETIQDFIIPLKIDSLKHSETNISLHRLNSIAFQYDWADGLTKLLDKLRKDGVANHGNTPRDSVNTWWSNYRSAERGILREPEELISNWYPVIELPEKIYLYRFGSEFPYVGELTNRAFPSFRHANFMLTFMEHEALIDAMPDSISPLESYSRDTEAVLTGGLPAALMSRSEAAGGIRSLLRQAWDREMAVRGMPSFEFSGGKQCFYFIDETVPQNRARFMGVKGRPTFRQVVGKRNMYRGAHAAREPRYWHFGLEMSPVLYPIRGFAARPHVLFSSDGRTVWQDPAQAHRARRNECKNWWNPEWRDRMLAAVAWLSQDSEQIDLPISPIRSLALDAKSLRLVSSVSLHTAVDEKALEMLDLDFGEETIDEEDDER